MCAVCLSTCLSEDVECAQLWAYMFMYVPTLGPQRASDNYGHMCSCMCSHWSLNMPFSWLHGTPYFQSLSRGPFIRFFTVAKLFRASHFYLLQKPHFNHKNKELDTGKNNVSKWF